MLNPRWRKVLRDLWLHKARTGLVVSAICIGIIGAGSVLDAWSLLRRVTRSEFDASNPASAVLRTDSVDAVLLARIRAMPAIAAAQTRRTILATVQTSLGPRTAMLTSADDFVTNRIGVIKPDAGAWPPRDGALVIEHSSVDFAGVALGDSLTIHIGDGPRLSLPVSGISRDVGLAPGWMEHLVYMFATPRTLAQLGALASMSELQFVVRDRSLDRVAVQRIARDVRTLVESTGRKVSDVNVPVPGRHMHAAQIDSLLYTQGAFGLLALFLSGLLVVNLISAMLTGQVREIGVMKAIGARGSQIAAMYLTLALLLGVIASLIAIPLAAEFGRLYAEFTADMLNFDIAGYRIPLWSFALQFAVGVLLPVLAAAVPVARGCRVSVSDALRDFGIAGPASGDSALLLHGTWGLPRPLLLSLRNAFRRRQRMALTLGTLSVGGAVYLGALNLRASVIGAVDLLFAPQHYDLSLRFAHAHATDSIMHTVTGVAGVASAEAWRGARALVSENDGPTGGSFPVTAPPLDSRLLTVAVDSGRWLQPGIANELVVNARLVEDVPGIVLGGNVSLIVDGRLARWKIVGIAELGPSPIAITTRETLDRLSGRVEATSVVIAAAAGAPASLSLVRNVRAALEERGFEISSGQLTSEQRSVMEDHLLMVAGFLGNMSLLMIVVGGLGLASTMSLAVLERTREIGVMRAIGARHGVILTMVQAEGLVIAILSWALAIPLSLPMSIALGNAFGRVMLKVPVHLVPEPAGVLRWLGVVVVLSLLACAWPALRATRITTAAALSS